MIFLHAVYTFVAAVVRFVCIWTAVVAILSLASIYGIYRYVNQARLVQWICTSWPLRKIFVKFSIHELHFPLHITGLEMETSVRAFKSPTLSVSLLGFRVHLSSEHLKRVLWQLWRREEIEMGTVVRIVMQGLHITASDAFLKDFMKPSNSALIPKEMFMTLLTARTSKYLPSFQYLKVQVIQFVSKIVSVDISDFNLTIRFKDTGTILSAVTPKMTIGSAPISDFSIHMRICIDAGKLTLTSANKRQFLSMWCSQYILRQKMHVPSGCMAVSVETFTVCDVEVDMIPFVQFYHAYQIVEDDIIELKLLRGADAASKMAISGQFSCLHVLCRDDRCDDSVSVRLELVEAGLKSWRLDRDRKRITAFVEEITEQNEDFYACHVSYWNSKDYTEDQEKQMTVTVGAVSFEDCELMSATDLFMEIRKHVYFAPTYKDREEIKMSAKTVQFLEINDRIFQWLCVLQDISTVLPISRFAHAKDSSSIYAVNNVEVKLMIFEDDDEDNSPEQSPRLEAEDRLEHHYPSEDSLERENDSRRNSLSGRNEIIGVSPEDVYRPQETSSPPAKKNAGSPDSKASAQGSPVLGSPPHPTARGSSASSSSSSSSRKQSATLNVIVSDVYVRKGFPSHFSHHHVSVASVVAVASIPVSRLAQEKNNLNIVDPTSSSVPGSFRASDALFVHSWDVSQIEAQFLLGQLMEWERCNVSKLVVSEHWDNAPFNASIPARSTVPNMIASVDYIFVEWEGRLSLNGHVNMNVNMKKADLCVGAAGMIRLMNSFDFMQDASVVVTDSMRAVKLKPAIYTKFPISPIIVNRVLTSQYFLDEVIDLSAGAPSTSCINVEVIQVNIPLFQDSSPLSTEIDFHGFEYKTHGPHKFEIGCKGCNVVFNDSKNCPFMYAERIFFQQMTEKVAPASQQEQELSVVTYEFELQFLGFDISPRLNIGATLEALFRQRDAFTAGQQVRDEQTNSATVEALKKLEKALKSGLTEDDEDNAALTKSRIFSELFQLIPEELLALPELTTKTIYKAKFDTFNVTVDSVYDNDFVYQFAVLEWKDYTVSLEVVKPEHEVLQDILVLDNICYNKHFCDTTKVKYDPRTQQFYHPEYESQKLPWIKPEYILHHKPFGGNLLIEYSEFTYKFRPMQQNYITMKNGRIHGLMYSASTFDSRSPPEALTVVLEDDEVSKAACSFRTRLTMNETPKYYLDLHWDMDVTALVLEPCTEKCLDAFNLAVTTCSSDEALSSPSLALWDNLRYRYHGRLHIHSKEFSITKVLYDVKVVKIILGVGIDQFQFYLDLNSVEMSGQNVVIDLNIFRPDIDVIPVPKFPIFCVEANGARSAGGDEKSNLTSNRMGWERIVRIPGFLFSLFHSPKDDSKEKSFKNDVPYVVNHHRIRNRSSFVGRTSSPARNRIITDKFILFRTSPDSVKWSMEIKLLSVQNESIMILAKLDVIHRLAEAVIVEKPYQNDSPDREMPPELEEEMKSWRTNKPAVDEPSMIDVLHSVDLQVDFDSMILCSWSSSDDYCGVVLTICKTQFQLRLIRELPSSKKSFISTNKPFSIPRAAGRAKSHMFSTETMVTSDGDSKPDFGGLQIDHLYGELESCELFAREWLFTDVDAPAVTTPLGTVLSPVTADALAGRYLVDVDDIKDMLTQLSRVAFATRVAISATESGTVAGKSAALKLIGVLLTHYESSYDAGSTNADYYAIGELRRRKLKQVAKNLQHDPRRFPGDDEAADEDDVKANVLKLQHFSLGCIHDCLTTLSNVQDSHSEKSSRLYLCRMLTFLSNYSLLPTEDQQYVESKFDNMKNFIKVIWALIQSRPRQMSTSPDIAASLVRISEDTMRECYLRYVFLDSPQWQSSHDWHQAGYVCNCRVHRAYAVQKAADKRMETHHKISMLTFEQNHFQLAPALNIVPSYTMGRKLGLRGAHNLLDTESNQERTVNGKSGAALLEMAKQTKLREHLEHRKKVRASQSTFGSKIWGLRVVDMRLLWTLPMREVLFKYGYSFTKYFGYNETEGIVVKSQERLVPIAAATAVETTKRESISSEEERQAKPGEQATLYDFLNYNDKFIADCMSDDSSPTGASSPNFQLLHRQSKKDRNSMSQLLQRSSSQVYRRISNERDRRHNAPYPYSPDNSPDSNALARLDSDEYIRNVSPVTVPTQPPHRKISARASFRSSFGAGAATAVSSRIRRLNSRRSVMDVVNPNASTATMSEIGGATCVTSVSKNSVPIPISISRQYLAIELVDPQINLLDIKKHSSMLIVAGKSLVEGYRQTNALVTVASGASMSDRGNDASNNTSSNLSQPRRQHELKVRFDGVSAFTVSSAPPAELGADVEDFVYWKKTDNADEASQGLDSLGRLYNKETVDVIFNSFTRHVSSRPSSPLNTNKATKRPSSLPRGFGKLLDDTTANPLKIAVRDFTIRINYLFWQDVTVREANEMYCEEIDDDLVTQFIMDIPQVSSDIVSSQFYHCINVIKNLLLVPPPTEITESEDIQKVFANQEEMNSVRRKSTDAIDLNRAASRAEIRSIVEKDLAHRPVVNGNMARLVEIVIGKCSWIMRSEDNTVEPIEAGFTGVYGKFIYHFDRYTFVVISCDFFNPVSVFLS
jgi:hypothetical protein